jgi:ring-1,2-phenylacetyl-CoA epoxidase subunit PaaE
MHLTHRYVAFVAGEGIEPILPLIETLLSRDKISRVQLFYGNRDREHAQRAEELLALKDRYLDRFALHFLMSEEPQEIEWLNGRLDAQKVEALAGKLFEPQAVRQFLVCGPNGMNAEVGGVLGRLGIDAAHVRLEPCTGDAQPAADGTGSSVSAGMTEVSVIMDGRRRSFTMRTDHDTVLEAAGEAGIDLPFSCKAGVCSTCRTKLVRGKVELAQNYALEDWELEQGFILACQAHAKTPELEITYDET